ncbi:MAG: tRNA (adenosine(37)-N6)-threonylcarbamoyltransferase complex ATPase subunit type 1 TsaE [Clostridiaceae bacterium]|nr:tRNA (adenosine(37)-N6)-threonylcarbamoyltransferase complex ATPase subunit type 1 TsaE [Clostridiaceae bacterium]
MRTHSVISESASETERWAANLAGLLRSGDVLALNGDLGAGKTAFVAGTAKTLGAKGEVASPTFTLLRNHEAGDKGMPLYHFDAYRLSGIDEWYELGFDEYLAEGGVAAVEWAERIRDALPPETIWIQMTRLGANKRRITISWSDERNLQECFA